MKVKGIIKVAGNWGAMGRAERCAFLAAQLRELAQAVEDDRAEFKTIRNTNGNTTRAQVEI